MIAFVLTKGVGIDKDGICFRKLSTVEIKQNIINSKKVLKFQYIINKENILIYIRKR